MSHTLIKATAAVMTTATAGAAMFSALLLPNGGAGHTASSAPVRVVSAPPAQLVTSAVRALESAGSVHVVETAKLGSAQLTLDGLVALSTGDVQGDITVSHGAEKVTFALVYTHGTDYLKGSASGWAAFLDVTSGAGVPASVAQRFSRHWVGVADNQYFRLGRDFDRQRLADEVALSANGTMKSLGTAVVAGQLASGIEMAKADVVVGAAAPVQLWVGAVGAPYPVRENVEKELDITFSAWSTASVTITAPRGVVTEQGRAAAT